MDLRKATLQLLPFIFSASAFASTTAFDAHFGSDGRKLGTGLSVASRDTGRSVIALADGKLILAGSTTSAAGGGDLLVTRLLANGDIDQSFGQQGKVNLDVAGGGDVGYHAIVQSDGKILVAGGCTTDKTVPCLFRLNANGSLDAGFATQGKFVYPFPDGDGTGRIIKIAVQSNGKIVAVGGRELSNSEQNADAFALRLTSNGVLDSSFATGGRYRSTTVGSDWAEAVAIDSHDRVVMAIYDSMNNDFVLERLTSNGTPDSAFNGTGRAVYDSGQIDLVHAITVDSKNRILAGGRIRVCGWPAHACPSGTGQFDAAVLRFTTTGQLDTDFALNGVATFDNQGSEYVTEVLSSNEDSVYFAGHGYQLINGKPSYLTFVSRLDGYGVAQNFGDYPVTINGSEGTAVVLKAGARTTVFLRGLSRLSSGGLVFAGSAYDEDESSKLTVAKIDEDGGFDQSFQDQGHRLFSVSGDDVVRWHHSVFQNNVSRILLGSTGGKQAVLACVDDSGVFDSSFGDNGTQVIAIDGDAVEQLASIDRSYDGGVVIAYATSPHTSDARIGVKRFTDTGQPNGAFGDQGLVSSTLDTDFSLASNTSDGIKRVLTSTQSDGTVTVAVASHKDGLSTVYLLRYNDAGEADPTLVSMPALGDFDLKAFMIDEGDHRLYLAGTVAGEFRIARLDNAGEIDTNFASNGWLSLDANTASVEKLSPGEESSQIFVIGSRRNGSLLSGFVLKFDGSFGSSNNFGTNGMQEFSIAGENAVIRDIQTRGDHKLFLVGTRFSSGAETDGKLFVLRTLPNGNLDPEFGVSGVINAAADDASDGRAIWLTFNGRLFVTGNCGSNACMMRANAQAGNPAPSTKMLVFGEVLVGATSEMKGFMLSNGENFFDEIVGPLQVLNITASGDFIVDRACATRLLEAWAACEIDVRFKPGASGNHSGVLTIATDAGIRTVSLSGIAIANQAHQPDSNGGGGSTALFGLLLVLSLVRCRQSGKPAR